MITGLSGTANESYAIEVVRTPSELLALRPHWESLCTRASEGQNAFSSFEWVWGWWTYIRAENARSGEQLHIIVVRRAGLVTGIMPLMMRLVGRGGMKIRKLEFIGGGVLADYQTPLFASDPVGQTRAVLAYLAATKDEWDLLELHNLALETANFLNPLIQETFPVRTVSGYGCPYFPITGPWNEILKRTSKNTRKDMRNADNRLRREGVHIRIVEKPDAEPDLLKRLVEVESRKIVGGRPGDDLLSRHTDFFQYIFSELGKKEKISIALMEKGSELMAFALFFRSGSKLWAYTTAYDPSFARLSPGIMLFPTMVDYAYACGCEEYDFLRGMESYKLLWATSIRPTCHFQVWHSSWRSRFAARLYFNIVPPVIRVLARVRGDG